MSNVVIEIVEKCRYSSEHSAGQQAGWMLMAADDKIVAVWRLEAIAQGKQQ